jgi:N12 class adenine-specific DNA methylase
MASFLNRYRKAEDVVKIMQTKIKDAIFAIKDENGDNKVLEEVEFTYNKKYNNYVPVNYTQARYLVQDVLEEAEANLGFPLYKNQVNWIIQAMYEGKGINAHDVGGGKTFSAIILLEALRRKGSIKKPLIAVPGKVIGNWKKEILRVFPDADIESLGGLRGGKEKREEVLFDIANRNPHFTLITHEGLNLIDVPMEDMEKYLDEFALEHFDDETKSGKAQLNLQDKIELYKEVVRRNMGNGKLTIDKLGFDSIVADEAHAFKNIGVRSDLTLYKVGIPFKMEPRKSKLSKELWCWVLRGLIGSDSCLTISQIRIIKEMFSY